MHRAAKFDGNPTIELSICLSVSLSVANIDG